MSEQPESNVVDGDRLRPDAFLSRVRFEAEATTVQGAQEVLYAALDRLMPTRDTNGWGAYVAEEVIELLPRELWIAGSRTFKARIVLRLPIDADHAVTRSDLRATAVWMSGALAANASASQADM